MFPQLLWIFSSFPSFNHLYFPSFCLVYSINIQLGNHSSWKGLTDLCWGKNKIFLQPKMDSKWGFSLNPILKFQLAQRVSAFSITLHYIPLPSRLVTGLGRPEEVTNPLSLSLSLFLSLSPSIPLSPSHSFFPFVPLFCVSLCRRVTIFRSLSICDLSLSIYIYIYIYICLSLLPSLSLSLFLSLFLSRPTVLFLYATLFFTLYFPLLWSVSQPPQNSLSLFLSPFLFSLALFLAISPSLYLSLSLSLSLSLFLSLPLTHSLYLAFSLFSQSTYTSLFPPQLITFLPFCCQPPFGYFCRSLWTLRKAKIDFDSLYFIAQDNQYYNAAFKQATMWQKSSYKDLHFVVKYCRVIWKTVCFMFYERDNYHRR